MTVKQLISELSKLDQDLIIYQDTGDCSVYYTPRVVFETNFVIYKEFLEYTKVAKPDTPKDAILKGVIIE